MRKKRWLLVARGVVCVIVIVSSYAFALSAKDCGDRYEECRATALSSSAGVIATTIALSACDAGFAACLFLAMIS